MRDIYIGTSAFVGRIIDETRCAFWPDDPRTYDTPFDPAKLVEVDLGQTLEAALAAGTAPESIQVEPIKTTLGPLWPQGPKHLGRVYLHEGYWKTLPPASRPPCPPTDASCRDYEYQLIVYRSATKDPRSGRRYQGIYARIAHQVGNHVELEVFEPGNSLAENAQRKRLAIDLDSNDVCPAPSRGVPVLGDDGRQEGALFIGEGRLFEIFYSSPKTPYWLGA